MRSSVIAVSAILSTLGLSTVVVLKGAPFKFKDHGLWAGFVPAAVASSAAQPGSTGASYDLTKLRLVNAVLKKVGDKYVDPRRVKPREMLLSALNAVQRDVAQIIVLHEDGSNEVKVRVDAQERTFRIDGVDGPWDVSARLHAIFAFVQEGLKGTEVDLREVEYAACNGMLHTLDPHSVLLSPDGLKELRVSTTGQFGGVGMVISLRDQQLTVMSPMVGGPADKRGVKKFDRIVKIGNESTLNMGVNEAVTHLRGQVGTKVKVWIHREGTDGWEGVKPFELTREVIRVASVDHRLLEHNVGYIRLKQFQQNTTSEMRAALTSMKRSGDLKGLVLDLRGNPGGLLDQAAKVVDTYISSGPIVATVGNPSEGRDEKNAHEEDTEPNYPIAMLVSGSSASASEIVAGALKNHDRAVIIGETTFGKGSVQLGFDDMPDGSALKLTIAQYLTEPGDISIQGVGVTPDIELDPTTVDVQEMDIVPDTGMLKERDLSRSLSNVRARDGQKPSETVRYSLSMRERLELRERGGDPDDNFSLDFPIRFARDFIARSSSGRRVDQLRQAKTYLQEVRKAEFDKVVDELKAVGIDWSDAPADAPVASGPAEADVVFSTDRPNNEATAGDSLSLKVTVTNKGTVPLFRLHGVTKSDNPLFDGRELVIGKVEPGKSRTTVIPVGWCETKGRKVGSSAPLPKDLARTCVLPKEVLTRADGVKLKFEEARGRVPREAETRVTLRALERPVFAYSYQVADNKKGNGDGRVQEGEFCTLYVTVKNVGRGRSQESQANLRNLSGDAVLLHEGRFDISNMQPGEVRKVAFTFEVPGSKQARADGEVRIELSIIDRDLREAVAEKLRLPLRPALTLTGASGGLRTKVPAELFASPDTGVRSFGRVMAGGSLGTDGTANGFARVQIGPGRFAFIRSADTEAVAQWTGPLGFEDTVHAPPAVEAVAPVLSATSDRIPLSGAVIDDVKVLDMYVFVGGKKVYYRSNRNGADARKLPFEASLPLRPGVNFVTVVARESPDTSTRRSFVIRRDGPAGELLATPKGDDEAFEGFPMGDD